MTKLEQIESEGLKSNIPTFNIGDTVKVSMAKKARKLANVTSSL